MIGKIEMDANVYAMNATNNINIGINSNLQIANSQTINMNATEELGDIYFEKQEMGYLEQKMLKEKPEIEKRQIIKYLINFLF